MIYLLQQIGGVLLAVVVLALAFYVPGKLLLRQFSALRFLFPARFGAALLLSIAVMPVTLYGLARISSLRGALLFCVVLVVWYGWRYGMSHLLPRRRHDDWISWALGGAWLALVIGLNVNIPCGEKLYASTLCFDWSKHIMVVDAMARTGVPPVNPAIYPEQGLPLCYYYFWHLLCAVFVSSPLTAQAVLLASVFWAGIAIVAVMHQFISLLYPAQGRPPHHPLRPLALVLLILVSNLAGVLLLVRIALYLAVGQKLEVDFLSVLHSGSEPVFSWMNSVLTAPHHVAAVVGALTGFLVLRRAIDLRIKVSWPTALIAGAAFASMAGMSIWVAVTAALIAGIWLLVLFVRGERRELALWLFAGVIAALLVAPFAAELHRANQLGGSPLVFKVRGFTFTHMSPAGWKAWLDLLCLPLNYFFEIGFPLLAAFLAWHLGGGNRTLTANERFVRVQFWASLILVSFFASAVRHDDLGWRGILFAQAACLWWAWPLFASTFPRLSGLAGTWPETAALRAPRLWKLTLFALWAGWLSALIDPLLLRCGNMLLDSPHVISHAEYSGLALPDDKQTAARLYAYRDGYEWLRTHTPPTARIAMNPDHHAEVPFFLFANRQAIACDLYNSTMFGINWKEYYFLRDGIAPLFRLPAPPWSTVRDILRPLGADYLILRSDDPIWGQSSDWPAPLYRNDKIAVFAL